jgi:hypothetical protein
MGSIQVSFPPIQEGKDGPIQWDGTDCTASASIISEARWSGSCWPALLFPRVIELDVTYSRRFRIAPDYLLRQFGCNQGCGTKPLDVDQRYRFRQESGEAGFKPKKNAAGTISAESRVSTT